MNEKITAIEKKNEIIIRKFCNKNSKHHSIYNDHSSIFKSAKYFSKMRSNINYSPILYIRFIYMYLFIFRHCIHIHNYNNYGTAEGKKHKDYQAGMWSRSRRIGLKTVSRAIEGLVKVSSRACRQTSRSRLGLGS